ncbi:Na+/melibiose symporter [Phyllobacterium sp. OV277]|nr:Na+/melibiose symporter [Phyllobacterium sp. OV277]
MTQIENAISGPGVSNGAAPMTALSEPVKTVSKRFISTLTLAHLGLFTSLFGTMAVLLPQQIEAIAPGQKESMLALVSGLGALASVFANPLVGAFSDRTTSRYGRRHLWTVGCAVIGALALASLGLATAIWQLIMAWCVAAACLNGMLASLGAEIPDHVPVKQRAIVGAFVGGSPPMGTIIGALVAAFFISAVSSAYYSFAFILVLSAISFVISSRDPILPKSSLRPFNVMEFIGGFWISPKKYPDFAWAWITRFLMQLGAAMFTLYLLYFLRDKLHYELLFPGKRSEDGLVLLVVIYTLCTVISGVTCGWLSDRSGRRKAFVILGGLIKATGILLFAMVPNSWPLIMVSAGVVGLGFGCYIAVDQAMITQVLPSAGDRGKDLGVINFAIAGPYALAPVIAGLLVTQFGYGTLYTIAAAIVGLSAILVNKIRSVR